MPLCDMIRKLKSQVKLRISYIGEVRNGSHTGAEQPSAINEVGTTYKWVHLRSLLGFLEQPATPFPSLKAAVTGIVECLGVYESVSHERKEYEALYRELERLFQTLQIYCTGVIPPIITATVESLCESIQNEVVEIRRKLGKGKRRAYLEAGWDVDAVLACYRRIQLCLHRILLNIDMSIWRNVDELATDNRLKHLSPSLSARYNSAQAVELKRGPCTKNTRVDLLNQIFNWLDSSSSSSVFWISGMAGTGKTTITYSLCLEMDAKQRLAASFFCSRLLPECRDVNLIIPSIAYQLARFSRPFRFVLSAVLEKDPDVHTQMPHLQFSALIARPLLQVKDTLPDSLVIVIDALDECENKESTRRILGVLLAESSDLPVKFVVSSRPEPEIRDTMAKQSSQERSRVILHELERRTVQADIETYLRATLNEIQPTEEQIAKLVERAGILFIYAATVVRYISHDGFRRNPRARLANILGSSSTSGNKHKEIDELYTIILEAAFGDPALDRSEREDIRLVMHTVLCAQEPLTVDALSGLLRMNDTDRVRAALRPLWSVLHISGTSELVTTLHASFTDYMLNPSRSKHYYCDSALHNQIISRLCFDCFSAAHPQFNICGLGSSYVPDDKVEGLEMRVRTSISIELFYAARYWATHLYSASESPDLIQRLEEFLSTRLLLWMEVMNLKKCAGAMPPILQLAEQWKVMRSSDLSALIHDAWKFTLTFGLSAASDSTPHIYTSMLPFWPELSPIARCYTRLTQGIIKPEGTAIRQREHALLATWSYDDYATTAAFSSDGILVAVGVGSKIILANLSTSRTALPPLEGHDRDVVSVQFSPDGVRLVSGSEDSTIRVWSTQSGKTILGPLTVQVGPDDFIHSRSAQAAFSPDGTCIMSVSRSGVCTWDASTGEHIMDIFRYNYLVDPHPINIQLVKYTPDGSCLVLWNGETIQICDARNGRVLRLLGSYDYNHRCTSIDVSPDGTRIATGCNHDSIRIWDFNTGELLLGPLRISSPDHFVAVPSVSFSPDGLYLVSVLSEDIICIWDARIGNLVSGPLGRHAKCKSLTFSANGICIISQAYDKMLRLWDTRSTHTIMNILPGHTNSVTSVGFSPGGTCIASGSEDQTTYLWNSEDGRIVFGPIKQTRCTSPVAFSPGGSNIILKTEYGLVVMGIQTGKIVLGPLQYSDLFSAEFSPDGNYIVVCEVHCSHPSPPSSRTLRPLSIGGCIVRTLSADTGQTLMTIRLPYSDLISTTFSPDSTRIHILFSSRLCLHSAHNGRMLCNEQYNDFPLLGLSPDGTRVVSSSTVVKDVQSGEIVLGPLEGHTERIKLVEFSPNGAHITSIAEDHAVCVWDAHTGQRVLGPVKWHTDSVQSVRFSPDGTRIVSGSKDTTIRVTDIRAVKVLDPSPQDIGDWELRDDGWVVGESDRLLVWIPPDLRASLMWPRTKLLISAKGYLRLNFQGAYIGESWGKCYRPDYWIRKLKSNAKSHIFHISGANDGSQVGKAQLSATDVRDARHSWTHLRSLLGFLEQATRPLPALKDAVAKILGCIDIYESVSHERKEYEVLYKELEHLFQALQIYCTRDIPPIITIAVGSLCGSIQSEIVDIRQKMGKGKQRLYLEAEQDADAVLSCYRRIQLYLQRISLNIDISVWRIVDEIATENRLKHLSPSLSARYNSAQSVELKRGSCTEGTRVDLLAQMMGWTNSSDSGSVYWMSGMAGTGKTTIAYTFCSELETNQRLAASFFCSRLLPECRDVNLIIPSIAYQLARFSHPFRFVLSRVLEKDPDVHTQLPHLQFNALVTQPLFEIKNTLPDSLVVVIDALDECENKESTRRILDVLLTKSSDLPVKFVVSSRPEPEIRDEMTKQTDQVKSQVVLHELDRQVVRADIDKYLRDMLAEINPTEDQITTLVERAGILFIYAATVVRYIGHDKFRRNPRSRLTSVLETSSTSENKHKEIDDLYSIILQTAIDDPTLDRGEKEDMRQVLHTVICAHTVKRNPLNLTRQPTFTLRW